MDYLILILSGLLKRREGMNRTINLKQLPSTSKLMTITGLPNNSDSDIKELPAS